MLQFPADYDPALAAALAAVVVLMFLAGAAVGHFLL